MGQALRVRRNGMSSSVSVSVRSASSPTPAFEQATTALQHLPRVARSRLKRGIDCSAALLLLLVLLPLLLLIAALIRCESRGPALFSQRRTGFRCRVFRIYKFRTMHVTEDGADVRHATRGDSRITRIGGFLRRTSLDELPQLWNVLRGDMSLIGPRPHAVAHDEYYGALLPDYELRFLARPGLTGLAQVRGLRGEIHTPDCMARRVEADREYIAAWSLAMDMRIAAATLSRLWRDVNAY